MGDLRLMHYIVLTDVFYFPEFPNPYVKIFERSHDVVGAFGLLFTKLIILFSKIDFVELKEICELQGTNPPEKFVEQIQAAKNSDDIFQTLKNPIHCNWFNVRLLRRIVMQTEDPEALELMDAYEKYLHPRKVSDVIVYFQTFCFSDKHVSPVMIKINKKANEVTVLDVIMYCESLESDIHSITESFNVTNFTDGCLTVTCIIPLYCLLHVYEMAKKVYLRFRQLHIQCLHIESFPKVFALQVEMEKKRLSVLESTTNECKCYTCIVDFIYMIGL